MAAPTRAELQAIIDLLVSDDEITDVEIQSAINEAILSVRGVLLVTSAATTPAAGQTVGVPAGFVYVYSVELDNEILPPSAWWVTEGTSPVITFNKPWFAGVAPSGTLTIAGGSFQETLSAPGDSLNVDPGYVIARALADLHASRGGTASDLMDWHKREHELWANLAEIRKQYALPIYGPPPGSRLIKGRLTA